MGIRKIRKIGDDILTKRSREVKEMDNRTASWLTAWLCVPGKAGQVTRPNYVKVRAKNREMQEIEVEGTELLARALCHELDHLEGMLYVERVKGGLHDSGNGEQE